MVTGICSFLSASLSSVSHNRLLPLVEKGNRHAAYLLELKRNIMLPKTALFITDAFFYSLGCVSIGGYATLRFSSIEVGAVAITATAVLLVIGKMLPRVMGERLAYKTLAFSAYSLYWIVLATHPLVSITRRFFNFFAAPTLKSEEETTREELDEILETAHEEGSLDSGEYRILKNIMRFTDVRVSDVMTPRTVVFACQADLPITNVVVMPEFRQYSRFPIYHSDSLDSVVGYVLTKDLLWAMVNAREQTTLRSMMREVYFIPENIQLDQALENFLERKEHLFVVVDEYGGVEGLLTMEDVMETLLGVEILDEADKVTNLRQLAKQRRDHRIATLQTQNAHLDVTTTDLYQQPNNQNISLYQEEVHSADN